MLDEDVRKEQQSDVSTNGLIPEGMSYRAG